MEKEKTNGKANEQDATLLVQKLQVLNEAVGRAQLASRVGTQTYSGNRDVYQALGYPSQLDYSQYYYPRYQRQDIAKAVIDRPVKASWKGILTISETADEAETAFEKGWRELDYKFKLKTVLTRADKLTGLGRYSIILFGMSDCKKIEDYAKPATKGAKLVYLKPLSEQTAVIDKFDSDVKSERFGLPEFYSVKSTESDQRTAGTTISIKVHYSRVLHLVEDILEDEVYGTPRLESVFNRLIDLEKLIGGDAEMFWRGARPGYTGTVSENYSMTPEAMKDLQSQIDEFEHNLRRVLINEGIDYKALDQQIADPKNHVDVQIQMISAVTGIPKRILVGSERGELSSAQDKQEWISYVTARREEQNEPMILRPFIDKCIELKILPMPKSGEYTVIWDKLFSLSDKEKVDVGKIRAQAIREYTTNPISLEILPMSQFLEYILGMDEAQVEEILSAQEEEFGSETIIDRIEDEVLKLKNGNATDAQNSMEDDTEDATEDDTEDDESTQQQTQTKSTRARTRTKSTNE